MQQTDQKFEVDKCLRGVLRHFYCIRVSDDADDTIQHLSPTLEMMVIFNFGVPLSFSFGKEKPGKRNIHRISILGPLRQMLNYERRPGTDLLGMAFIYDGFYRFQSSEGQHLHNREQYDHDPKQNRWEPGSASDADKSTQPFFTNAEHLNHLWEIMAPMTDNAKRVAVLQNYLISHLVQPEQRASVLIDNAAVVNNTALNPVNVLAEKAAVSDRTIQKRFKKYVGYSPKELLRFLRFKAVVHFILENHSRKIDWFEIIHTYNYHDQSHLIKDFKYFTGVTPRQFLKMNDEENFCMHTD